MNEHIAEKDALAKVLELHRPVQWKGWQLWAARIAKDGRAFVDRWCLECRKEWPCPTARCVTPPAEGRTDGAKP